MPSILPRAWQSWKSDKGIALLAVIAFAVGIGSATAIYTVVNAVMLGALPYPQGDRFAALYEARFTEPALRGWNTEADLQVYQQRTSSFDVFGWLRLDYFNLSSPGTPQHIGAASVTPSLALNLGVAPRFGRWFADDSETVISYALWRRLGANPAMVGQAITLDGRRLAVVGVMPPGFHLPVQGIGSEGFESDAWLRLNPSRSDANQRPGPALYLAYARRKPGVSLTQAVADAKRVAVEIAAHEPASHAAYTARLDDLHATTTSNIRPTLLLLSVAAGLLLMIACANVAGLLLARSVARARDTATRIALGASRSRLALHYFAEGLFVSLGGAAGGVLMSVVLVRVVVRIASDSIPRASDIAINSRVLMFGIGTAVLSSGLSSLAPLWQALGTAAHEVLGSGVRASAGARVRRLSRSLVVAEIALAFTLLAASAVLIAHLQGLTRTAPGFDANQLLTFQLTLPDSADDTRSLNLKRFKEALEAIPGVTGAAFGSDVPLEGCCFGGTIYPEGRTARTDAVTRTSFLFVSASYAQTMRIPLQGGRFLSEVEPDRDVVATVINQAAARRYWPDRNPIGAYGRLNTPDGSRFQVVGIAGDVLNDGLDKAVVPELYFPSALLGLNLPVTFIVRSPLAPDRLIPEVRRAVAGVDPALPVYDIITMNEIVGQSVTFERVRSIMVAFFAAAALLMASLGVFGVVSYSVRQRRVEIGTRMALGAVGHDLVTLVMGGALRMAVQGVAVGAVAVAVTVWLFMRFYGVHDIGWQPFASSITMVAFVTTAASSLPAWRATRLSPMVAIRDETPSLWRSAQQTITRAIRELSSRAGSEVLADGTVVTDFADAVRRAESPTDALHLALATLCSRLGAESAMLLEKVSAHEFRCTAASPEESVARCSLPDPGLLLDRLRYHAFPLPLTAGDVETLLRWVREHRPGGLAEVQTLKDLDVRLAAPLRTKQEILGVVLLGPPIGRVEYSLAERQQLRICADQFALMIENARLTGRVVEQQKLARDLALAAEVQRRLLPESPPRRAIADLAAVSVPARTVGGDYYDFIDLGDDRIGIALADVAGKGIPAALIMSVVQASLRIISSEGQISLPQLTERMNRFLHRSTASNSYATFFYAQIDEQGRQLRYVNAGHNPPYFLRSIAASAGDAEDESSVDIQELTTGGAVIGLFPQMTYEEAAIDLRSGDVMVAFTDGVIEALNAGQEEFGEERLKDLLRRLVHLPVQEISARISGELKNWIKDAAQYDDLTFIVMKVN